MRRTCHVKRVNGAQRADIKTIKQDTCRPFCTNLNRIRPSARRVLRSHFLRLCKALEAESSWSNGRLRPQSPADFR